MSQGTTRDARIRRHARIRRKVTGTAERPRLSVYRSSKHIYAQIIDDSSGRTIAAASDGEPAVTSEAAGKDKTARAAIVGKQLAARATAAGVGQVVFDRGGFQYHGRVKALADAAREGGLGF